MPGVCVEYVEHPSPTLDMVRFDLFGREILTWGLPPGNIDRLATGVERLSLDAEKNQAAAHSPSTDPPANSGDEASDGIIDGMCALSLSDVSNKIPERVDGRSTPSEHRCRLCGNVFSMKKTLSMHSKVCV